MTFAALAASISREFRYGAAWKFGIGYNLDAALPMIMMVQLIVISRSNCWSWLNAAPVRYVGRISYSIYLYHGLGARDSLQFFPGAQLWIAVPVALAFDVAMGSVSYYLIARPFLRLKSRIGQKSQPVAIPQAASL